MEQGGKNLIFIWGPNAQHENEATGKLPPYRVKNHIVRPRRVIFLFENICSNNSETVSKIAADQ